MAQTILNTMMNNFKLGTELDRNGERFLGFCIKKLKSRFGASERYIFCELLRTGLQNHETYRSVYSDLIEEYDRIKQQEDGKAGR